MLLTGKRLLITGVLTHGSIAWHTAKVAQEQGAQIVLTGFGRGMRLTERSARRLPDPPDVFELDINDPTHMEQLVAELTGRWGSLDGAVHAIAYAPEDALGGNFLTTPSESAALAFTTSTFSYKTLAVGLLPLFREAGGGIAGHPRLRQQHPGLARLRLDGRLQGRPRLGDPLPGP